MEVAFTFLPLPKLGLKENSGLKWRQMMILTIGTELLEIPQSETVIDKHPFVNGPVNWVTEDTKYEHPLILHTQEDFSIGGKIIFVIEPKCTLETIGVLFKYKNGVLSVEPLNC